MLNFNKIKKALVVAPHPDDAELGMGGTIARMIASGWDVCVVDLTDGEPTPFGSKEIRAQEATLASNILGIQSRLCLDLPNRRLEATFENRKRLAEVIRQFRPVALFGPCLPDWHPDHAAAAQLVEVARFEAKYHKTDMKGQPHWTPKLYHYYSPHRLEYQRPSFIVDISDTWQKKKDAIGAYKSQIENSEVNQSVSLIERCEIVSGFFGLSIASKYGEPFICNEPISI
jgi:bacillithiol biosynthesis deacetylase BshB1